MKTKHLDGSWGNIIGEHLPQIEIRKGKVDWILSLLGWDKDARRSK